MSTYPKIFCFTLLFSFFSITILQAQDFISSLQKEFDSYSLKLDAERVFVVTDKDIYVQGDPIWFTAVAYKLLSPVISQRDTDMTLQVLNSEFDIVLEDVYKAEKGRVSSHFVVPSDLMSGVYYVHLITDRVNEDARIKKKIIVKDKLLPPFVIQLVYPEKDYNPGDQIPITLEFKNYFSNPQKGVDFEANFYDGNALISNYEGKTKKDGIGSFTFKIPSKTKSGIITYHVDARCKGIGSQLQGIIYAVPADIFMDFYPDNGRIIDGITSTVYVFSYFDLGQSAAVEAEILENGKVIAKVSTENNGMGKFDITPVKGSTYEYRILKPAELTKTIHFPEIADNGIDMKVIKKTEKELQYKLTNGYQNERLVYLFGISDGEIFWSSKHKLENEEIVNIDLSGAAGVMAYFVAVNAAERIEGEHVVSLLRSSPKAINMNALAQESAVRGLVAPELIVPEATSGHLVVSAINTPWMLDGINNAHPSIIGVPGDAVQQLIFERYGALYMNAEMLETLLPYYKPIALSWKNVLNTKGCYQYRTPNAQTTKNQQFIDQFAAKYKVIRQNDKSIHTNILCDDSFVLSNPDFVENLDFEKPEKVPAYKQLLAKGNVPMIDILNTIKPCKLVGNRIEVFSANSALGGSSGSLLVIDGVPRGYDATLLTGMNQRSIESIKISTQAVDIMKYSGFNTEAVIEVRTKKGEEKTKPAVEIDKDLEFSSPDYGKNKSGSKDYRSTLFWTSKTISNDKSEVTIKFYNSDLIGEIDGNIYFFPGNGVPVLIEYSYKVK